MLDAPYGLKSSLLACSRYAWVLCGSASRIRLRTMSSSSPCRSTGDTGSGDAATDMGDTGTDTGDAATEDRFNGGCEPVSGSGPDSELSLLVGASCSCCWTKDGLGEDNKTAALLPGSEPLRCSMWRLTVGMRCTGAQLWGLSPVGADDGSEFAAGFNDGSDMEACMCEIYMKQLQIPA